MRYVVHVQQRRVVRPRAITCWVLGPYRFRWMARLAAWLSTINSVNISQVATVHVEGAQPHD